MPCPYGLTGNLGPVAGPDQPCYFRDMSSPSDYGYRLEYPPVIFPPPAPRRRFPWINLVLLITTAGTTLLAGTYMAHFTPNLREFLFRLHFHPEWLLDGLPFSITLIVILGSHEMGHFLLSRHHRVQASLPYFIPAPNLVGTFGALIFMRGRISDRRALVDIGAAGPLLGFLVSLFALYVGIQHAQVAPMEAAVGQVLFNPNVLEALAFSFWLGPVPAKMIIISPILDAAWVGFFVTMINLLPIGQLDGGHIAYAVFGRRTLWLSWLTLALLIVLSRFWPGWGVFALFVLILMGRRGIQHPPPEHPEVRLDALRWLLALAALLVFLLCFMPQPFTLVEPPGASLNWMSPLS